MLSSGIEQVDELYEAYTLLWQEARACSDTIVFSKAIVWKDLIPEGFEDTALELMSKVSNEAPSIDSFNVPSTTLATLSTEVVRVPTCSKIDVYVVIMLGATRSYPDLSKCSKNRCAGRVFLPFFPGTTSNVCVPFHFSSRTFQHFLRSIDLVC